MWRELVNSKERGCTDTPDEAGGGNPTEASLIRGRREPPRRSFVHRPHTPTSAVSTREIPPPRTSTQRRQTSCSAVVNAAAL